MPTRRTPQGSVSGYAFGTSGILTLLTPGGVTASQPSTTGPIDDIVTPDNKFLYVIDSMAGKASGTIAGFSIGTGGALTSVPTNTTGMVPGQCLVCSSLITIAQSLALDG